MTEAFTSPAPVPADELIRRYILARGLQPGDQLPTETELCTTLGVARNRLREGIQRLQANDVVCVRHGVGMFVGGLSLRPLAKVLEFQALVRSAIDRTVVADILDVRIAVDRGLAPQVCERMTNEAASELHDICTAMLRCAEAGESFSDPDRLFHLQLSALVGNQLASELVVAFWEVMRELDDSMPPHRADEVVQTAKMHRALVDAALQRDVDAYVRALDGHYRDARRRIDEWVASGSNAASTRR